MDQTLQGQIRTALSAIAGIAVSMGWTDSGTATFVTGIAIYAVTAIWSWKSKKPLPPIVGPKP